MDNVINDNLHFFFEIFIRINIFKAILFYFIVCTSRRVIKSFIAISENMSVRVFDWIIFTDHDFREGIINKINNLFSRAVRII